MVLFQLVSLDNVLMLINIINYSFSHNIFPQEPHFSEVIPLCKKSDSLQKKNYSSVSLLHHIFKIFKENHSKSNYQLHERIVKQL